MKKCKKCGEIKPLTQFNRSGMSGGQIKYRAQCRDCTNTDELKLSKRNGNLLSNYGITVEDYERIYVQQRGLCVMCGKPEMATDRYGKVKRLAVDHSHKTGKVRALLCQDCNTMIGLAREDKSVLAKAILYLEEHD